MKVESPEPHDKLKRIGHSLSCSFEVELEVDHGNRDAQS